MRFLILYLLIIFSSFIFKGFLPIPSDTIVGLYHPWRDSLVNQYPNGVAFKNFLITDPVRQQYPWRELAMENIKKGQLPNWNPYVLAGVPLLANIQAAVFYPLNIIYFLMPFSIGWSMQIVLQTLLGGVFMLLFLRNLKLCPEAQILGALAWVGSGFFTAWQEWNTVVQVAIWLPLILLSIDKIFVEKKLRWYTLFIISVVCSFFAGHVQVFFYVSVISFFYFLSHVILTKKYSVVLWLFVSCLLVILFTSIQWLPMITLFQQGVRSVPLDSWLNQEWFLPWQNLAQFIAAVYFGNPGTLNYFGIWNYGEFVGYVGIAPLFFALFAINKKNKFWTGALLLSLLFVLSNPISQLPFRLGLPLISWFQPTRLMVLVDFSLAILAAIGIDRYLKEKNKIYWPTLLIICVTVTLWLIAIIFHLPISRNNLILPTILVFSVISVFFINKKYAIFLILVLTVFDLSRFNIKFNSFSDPEFLYPQTKITNFLQDKSKTDIFRVAALDDRIFPPNFSTHYKIQMISGYDSIFPRGYFTSGRIIVPKDLNDTLFTNVRYVLSFEEIVDVNYQLVMQEGQTKLYENKNTLPRVKFAGDVLFEKYSENEIILKTSSQNEAELTLYDAYYPGWQATVDGKETKIYPTDNIFRKVVVPKGEHMVRFSISL